MRLYLPRPDPTLPLSVQALEHELAARRLEAIARIAGAAPYRFEGDVLILDVDPNLEFLIQQLDTEIVIADLTQRLNSSFSGNEL